jgi:hypothetical protein
MKNFFYLAITLCIATCLIFVSCDKANNDDEFNDSLNFNGTASSLSDNLGRANDIPAEYIPTMVNYIHYLQIVSKCLFI